MKSLARRLPGREDIILFLSALTRPRRLSAIRAAADAYRVARTLEHRGVRPLLPHHKAERRTDVEMTRRVAAAVDAGLAIVPMKATCLRRSIGLIRELDRMGLEGTVHIGVRRDNDQIEAHAWVQVGETVVNDDPAIVEHYTELAAGTADDLLANFR